ncbi:glycoside hydrolase family 78 protein [Flavilitoribacter nigricans]|uniref:alpha-L-rhamnosidase n=1 Tax=Flavilitoribacter nigricans (strain ATCC 23147 / DSM 23189 / NBRC 102662 / NCIMB 1420 / SS-2) TaxID=1122177 RepID=A0A2D0MWW6_FLAN2|nr:alpha-rhamnosidase [Flavilitoribacter nigricans DSM 23189 = NBRC 102662]
MPLICLALFTANSAQAKSIAVQLQCEYLTDPIGLDTPEPRLRWKMEDDRQGARQGAYRIWVGTEKNEVDQGKGNMWESGMIKGAEQLVRYAGRPLQPFTRYYWRVQLWDKDDQAGAPSETASFETGMMDISNWQGAWITDTRDEDLKPAPYFRKEFSAEKPIAKAQVYVAAAGLYELFVNGERIGDQQLDPMYTRFDRRNLYVAYDLTEQVRSGENAIGVILGNGWYNHQSTAVWYFHQAPWRARPKFCLDLRITYEDGTTEVISTDNSWKTALSPVIFNSIYTAEHYDARLEQEGWNEAGFADKEWRNAELTPSPSQNVLAQTLHPIRHTESIRPVGFRKISDRQYIYDLGKNIAGVSRITARGSAGTTLRLTHSELLDDEGMIDQSNIDIHYRPTDDSDPFQTDIFILKGEGEESFTPKFNYKGFQYVEVVSDQPIELNQESLTGLVMHSDVPPVGRVSSSNPTLDKIWEATNSSYLANLFGYPTDCPQREKNGWTGDAHIAIETGLYNFDGITVYEKWLGDHRDEQQPNGVLPAIIPTSGWGYQWANGPDWTSTIAIIPWNIYLFYGDASLLEACYDNIKRYVDHITDISQDHLTTWGLGDWVPVKSKSPVEFTSSIYYFVDASILARTAKLLGHDADHQKYSALADRIKAAINAKYLKPETASYGSGLQTELSAALHWGIVPEELRQQVADNLAQRVITDKRHIDVGLLGTKTILNALSDNGHADLAYTVAAQETFPSWGWWIVSGSTTLSENWDLEAGSDISRNHIMFGEIGAWYYKALGGIKPDPAEPGFKHVLLEPHFVPDLQQFSATHESPYGEIRSSWERKGKKVSYQLTIPPNSRGTVVFADAQKISMNGKNLSKGEAGFSVELLAGNYEFEIEE